MSDRFDPSLRDPDRFDLSRLDPDDPFEVDADNWPHLYKHSFERPRGGRPVRIELPDILDLYVWNGVLYYPADMDAGDAHWLLVCEVEGIVVTVPLAPPRSGDPTKCRPIGLYPAAATEEDRYRQDS
jgi:hypothetical protein